MLKILANKKGISYVEILTVISIMMILTVIAVANIRGVGTKGTLYVSVQKIISDIRVAQSYALSAKEFEGVDPPRSPEGGWGIYFNKDENYFSIFADLELNEGEGYGDYVCHSKCGDLSEERYQKINMPEGVRIERIYKIRSYDGFEVPGDEINIVFEPPEPIIHQCEIKDDCDYDRVGIVFTIDGLDKREITVNFFGLIDTADVPF